MKSHLQEDKVFVDHQLAGDAAAFEQIYRRYWRPLYRTARHKLRTDEAAEELVQTVFVSLWEKRTFTVIDNIEAYLFTALKYQIINHYKTDLLATRHVELSSFMLAGQEDTEQRVTVNELSEAFEQALHLLPEQTRTIFRLSRLGQQSVREIARQLHMPERTVEYHITKSIKFLRVALKDYLPLIVILSKLYDFSAILGFLCSL